MTEGNLVVASAVVVPEEELAQPVHDSTSPYLPHARSGSLKRRQSSSSSTSSKRPRLSKHEDPERHARHQPDESSIDRDRHGIRKTSLQTATREDRQRGKRLFGGLLGALSQSSASAAQKRRVDIEKKQQAKILLQAEEDENARQQRLDALQHKRRKEQVIWDERSMRIRHSNMTAVAKFLQTDSEPRLHYLPFKLRPYEQDQISKQIRQAEDDIDRELDEWDDRRGGEQRHEHEAPTLGHESPAPQKEQLDVENYHSTKIGEDEISGRPESADGIEYAEVLTTAPAKTTRTPDDAHDTSHANGEADVIKDSIDDGGEVLEGDEDTVIY